MSENKISTIVNQFDGILIIPIKGDEPVLVFKNLGKPFFEDYISGNLDEGVTDAGVFSDYLVTWKGKLLEHDFPLEVNQQYGNSIKALTEGPIPYDITDLPKGVVELPLNIVMGDKNIKIFSPYYIKPVRKALRKIGILKEKRGKIKKRDKIVAYRDKFILQQYKSIVKTHKRKILPIKTIQQRWTNKLISFYPDDSKKVEKYEVSDATIRRVLKRYIKK